MEEIANHKISVISKLSDITDLSEIIISSIDNLASDLADIKKKIEAIEKRESVIEVVKINVDDLKFKNDI
tara:strand:- start:1574 stop:1783 length:210 start_codon:yes stop_codon:yes gene_type:complete